MGRIQQKATRGEGWIWEFDDLGVQSKRLILQTFHCKNLLTFRRKQDPNVIHSSSSPQHSDDFPFKTAFAYKRLHSYPACYSYPIHYDLILEKLSLLFQFLAVYIFRWEYLLSIFRRVVPFCYPYLRLTAFHLQAMLGTASLHKQTSQRDGK